MFQQEATKWTITARVHPLLCSIAILTEYFMCNSPNAMYGGECKLLLRPEAQIV